MAIVVIQLVDTPDQLEPAPTKCPHCGSLDIQHWGTSRREIHDIKPVSTYISRYYCNYCHSTFRYYPDGFDQCKHSERIRRLAALIWLMDLSVRDVTEVFDQLGVKLNRMAVWSEGQKLVRELNSLKFLSPNNRFSIDKTIGLENRPDKNVMLVLSFGTGNFTILGSLNTRDPNAVIAWLKPILDELGAQIIILGTQEFTSTEHPPTSDKSAHPGEKAL